MGLSTSARYSTRNYLCGIEEPTALSVTNACRIRTLIRVPGYGQSASDSSQCGLIAAENCLGIRRRTVKNDIFNRSCLISQHIFRELLLYPELLSKSKVTRDSALEFR